MGTPCRLRQTATGPSRSRMTPTTGVPKSRSRAQRPFPSGLRPHPSPIKQGQWRPREKSRGNKEEEGEEGRRERGIMDCAAVNAHIGGFFKNKISREVVVYAIPVVGP